MINNDRKPLGYVDLPDGKKPIYPMNDIFLTFTFENPAHWEALRVLINIFYEEYQRQNPNTDISLIKDEIHVRSQYKHLKERDEKTAKQQDIRIDSADKITYVEFQNKAHSYPPLEIRSIEYFGLGISNTQGKIADQVWLLAEPLESILHGQTFARYILKDEVIGTTHPNKSGILYIDMQKLSTERTPAGELAAVLLGKNTDLNNAEVRKIVEAFSSSFQEFQSNEEVSTMLSLAERYTWEGRLEGREEGREEGLKEGRKEGTIEGSVSKAMSIAKNLLNMSLSVDQIVKATGLSREEIEDLQVQGE